MAAGACTASDDAGHRQAAGLMGAVLLDDERLAAGPAIDKYELLSMMVELFRTVFVAEALGGSCVISCTDSAGALAAAAICG